MSPIKGLFFMVAWFGGAMLFYWIAATPPCERVVLEALVARCEGSAK